MAVAVFFPIILQSLAAGEAFEKSNHEIKCVTTAGYQCDIKVFGRYIDTSSAVLYATSFSVFIQFILFTTMGSLADYGPNRLNFMTGFGILTSLVGFCIIVVTNSSLYWVAFLIYVLSNTAFGASYVFLYSWVMVD